MPDQGSVTAQCDHRFKRWLHWAGAIAGWRCRACGYQLPSLLRFDEDEGWTYE